MQGGTKYKKSSAVSCNVSTQYIDSFHISWSVIYIYECGMYVHMYLCMFWFLKCWWTIPWDGSLGCFMLCSLIVYQDLNQTHMENIPAAFFIWKTRIMFSLTNLDTWSRIPFQSIFHIFFHLVMLSFNNSY